MQKLQNSRDSSQSPPNEGRFAWSGLALALVAAPVVGAVWAWIGNGIQAYFAPMILFPLLVGVVTGLSIVGLVRFAQMGHRPTILMTAVAAAVVAAAGQHYCHYLSDYFWKKQPSIGTGPLAGQDLSALTQGMTPSFGKYLSVQARRGRPLPGGYVVQGCGAWLSWGIEALLSVAAAVGVTLPALRVPYCNRCGTWYRTIRNGRIDVPTARRLAETLDVDLAESMHSPRYRLSACRSGCGPMRCELSWEESNGVVDLARVWLDAEKRNKVLTVLDELAETGEVFPEEE